MYDDHKKCFRSPTTDSNDCLASLALRTLFLFFSSGKNNCWAPRAAVYQLIALITLNSLAFGINFDSKSESGGGLSGDGQL